MINANRFSKPVGTVQLGNVAQLPFEQMMQGLATHQSRYDQIAQAAQQVADRELSYLDADAEAAAGIMDRQRQLEQDILDMGDLSRQAREATGKLRGFTKEVYGKHGQGTAIEGSYANYQETLKRIQESNLPQKEKDMAMAMWLSKYEGVGEGVDVGYGAKKYNTFGIKNAPEYIDMHKYASEIMSKMKPQELAEKGVTMSKDGRWLIKQGTETKILTIDEMMKVIEPIAAADPKFQEYQNFRGELYRYQLKSNPDFIKSSNAERKLQIEKAQAAREEIRAKKDNLLVGTGKERQEKINALIEELNIPIKKVTVDGKIGEQTQKALDDIDTFFQAAKINEDLTFEEWNEDDFVNNYLSNARKSTFRATADIFDVNNRSVETDMVANQFALQDRQFAHARRLKKMEIEATIPRTHNVTGTTSKQDLEIKATMDKDGNIVVKDEDARIKKLNLEYRKAYFKVYGRYPDDGSGQPDAGMLYDNIGNEAGVKQNRKSKRTRIGSDDPADLAALRRIEKQLRETKSTVTNNYQQDFDKYYKSISKGGTSLTRRQAWEQYQKDIKEFYTTSGTVTQVGAKLEEKLEKSIMDGDLTAQNLYYVDDGGNVVRLTEKQIKKMGDIESVNLEGAINPSTSTLDWNSGYAFTIKTENKGRIAIYKKQSSNQDDNIGSAGRDISSLYTSLSQSVQTVQRDYSGNPLFPVTGVSTYVNGRKVLAIKVPPQAMQLVPDGYEGRARPYGKDTDGSLLFDPTNYTTFANLVGGQLKLID